MQKENPEVSILLGTFFTFKFGSGGSIRTNDLISDMKGLFKVVFEYEGQTVI